MSLGSQPTYFLILAEVTNASTGTLALITFSIEEKNIQTLCLVLKTYILDVVEKMSSYFLFCH
jgi:hypothetical protein